MPFPLCRADQLAGLQRYSVAVSRDAGRFVCNFTYYVSLKHSQTMRQQHAAPLHVLFVHMPPATAVPLEQQFEFLLDLLAAIAAALAPAAMWSSVEHAQAAAAHAAAADAAPIGRQ